MPQRHRFAVRPLFLQLRDELVARIASGVWKPGALLPNEIQLANEFGVSQGTMRKALDLMEAERIVARQPGRGTTVVDHDTDEMAIRFSSIFNSLNQRISGHIISCEAKFDTATQEEALELRSGSRVARAERVRAYHDHPFMVERVTLSTRHFPKLDLDDFRIARLSAVAQRHGVLLSTAHESVSPILCPEEHLAALDLSEPTPVLLLHRLTYNDRNEPVELRIGWCHLRDKHYMSITT